MGCHQNGGKPFFKIVPLETMSFTIRTQNTKDFTEGIHFKIAPIWNDGNRIIRILGYGSNKSYASICSVNGLASHRRHFQMHFRSARTSRICTLQSPNRVKVLSRSGIKHEGHITSVYRSHYERNWVLMSVSRALKELKTSQLDHGKS